MDKNELIKVHQRYRRASSARIAKLTANLQHGNHAFNPYRDYDIPKLASVLRSSNRRNVYFVRNQEVWRKQRKVLYGPATSGR